MGRSMKELEKAYDTARILLGIEGAAIGFWAMETARDIYNLKNNLRAGMEPTHIAVEFVVDAIAIGVFAGLMRRSNKVVNDANSQMRSLK